MIVLYCKTENVGNILIWLFFAIHQLNMIVNTCRSTVFENNDPLNWFS